MNRNSAASGCVYWVDWWERGVDAETGEKPDVKPLSQVLDRLKGAVEGEAVSVEQLVEVLGRRSFPALILAPCLLAVSPASGIPGITSAVGLLVALFSAQMLLGFRCAWLPGFLKRRSFGARRLRSGIDWLRRPVGFVERASRPRLVILATRPFVMVPLAVLTAIGAMMPLLEFIPTSGSIAAAVASVFAIGLIMRDGVVVLLALALSGAVPYLVWQIIT
jgi:hypothetical protein